MRAWHSWVAVVVMTCCGLAAAGAGAGRSKPPKAPPGPKYDLSFRPAAGQRSAWEQSYDVHMDMQAAGNRNGVRVSETFEQHRQLSIARDEVTEVRDGEVTGRRVAFGPKSWRMERTGKQQPEPVRLVYANKTVQFRLTPEDTVEQNFGVKPTGDILRLIKYTILGRNGWLPGKPVAVGERWRADEGLRSMLDAKRDAIVSGIATLKGLRTQAGRQVADLAVSGGALVVFSGANAEVNVEGTVVVDVQTGAMLRADLVGQMNAAAGMGDAGNNASAVSLTLSGKIEIHQTCRLLANRGENDDSDVPTVPAQPTTQPVARG